MRSIKIISLLLLLAVASCDSTSEPPVEKTAWRQISSLNNDVNYNSIFFVDENNGWIAGNSGIIKHSTDGGKSWSDQSSGVSSDLWDIQFIDSQFGFACGKSNTILKTINSGVTWQDISIPSDKEKLFISLKFTDQNTGWTITNYGNLYKTTNGGGNWQSIKNFREMGADLVVINENTVYLLQNKFYKTFDSGATWDSTDVPYPKNYMRSGMLFVNEQFGVITLMNGTGGLMIMSYPVLITNDGGLTWHESEYIDGELGIRNCYFINKHVGWITGVDKIYKTTNGGKNWEIEFSTEGYTLYSKDIYFLKDEIWGWVLTYKGLIYKCEPVTD